ncbi:MAG: orotidine-5'-phosphate decarboxylase [Nanoarchaeota archaeon]|nr:orotidine-5'-phosphate decarboxylase [Nanoarchaeota archaeon]
MSDKLLDAIDKKRNPCIVGLDSVIERIPRNLIKGDSITDTVNAYLEFNCGIIDAVADLVPGVKPQIAFYEKYKSEGVKAFEKTVDYAKSKGLIVIEDGKRNDLSNTAQAYADGHLGEVSTLFSSFPSFDVDLLTVTPYLGSDGITPFVDVCKEHEKGIFILVKTSNPSSAEFQDRIVRLKDSEMQEFKDLGVSIQGNETEMYNLVALTVNKYAQQTKGSRGYSPIGPVVGATYPEQAELLRKIMPDSIFLVPGYGNQGGLAKDVMNCFNPDGYGAVINNARGIIYAYEGTDMVYAEAARTATKDMIEDICSAMKTAGKYPLNWR